MSKTMVVIGCGGLAYHGMPRMANFCYARGIDKVVYVDPDVVKEENGTRQWIKVTERAGYEIVADEPKVVRMAQVVENLGIGQGVVVPDKVENARVAVLEQLSRGDREVWVVGLPDSHEVRMEIMKLAGAIRESGRAGGVMLVMGGNGQDDGWATAVAVGEGKRWWKGWPDLDSVEEQAREEKREKPPAGGCGAMPERVEGQTAMGNMLTAVCLWEAAESLNRGQATSVYWERDGKGNGKIYSRNRKKWVTDEGR